MRVGCRGGVARREGGMACGVHVGGVCDTGWKTVRMNMKVAECIQMVGVDYKAMLKVVHA